MSHVIKALALVSSLHLALPAGWCCMLNQGACATSPAKAATSCLRLIPDCLLVTGTPSGINDVLAALQESLDQIPVIAITDPGTDSGAIETPLNKAIGREVGECLNREAVSSGVLRRTVSRAIEMTRMQCLI